jgi:hypothetical protein
VAVWLADTETYAGVILESGTNVPSLVKRTERCAVGFVTQSFELAEGVKHKDERIIINKFPPPGILDRSDRQTSRLPQSFIKSKLRPNFQVSKSHRVWFEGLRSTPVQ